MAVKVCFPPSVEAVRLVLIMHHELVALELSARPFCGHHVREALDAAANLEERTPEAMADCERVRAAIVERLRSSG